MRGLLGKFFADIWRKFDFGSPRSPWGSGRPQKLHLSNRKFIINISPVKWKLQNVSYMAGKRKPSCSFWIQDGLWSIFGYRDIYETVKINVKYYLRSKWQETNNTITILCQEITVETGQVTRWNLKPTLRIFSHLIPFQAA